MWGSLIFFLSNDAQLDWSSSLAAPAGRGSTDSAQMGLWPIYCLYKTKPKKKNEMKQIELSFK